MRPAAATETIDVVAFGAGAAPEKGPLSIRAALEPKSFARRPSARDVPQTLQPKQVQTWAKSWSNHAFA